MKFKDTVDEDNLEKFQVQSMEMFSVKFYLLEIILSSFKQWWVF